MMYHAVMSSPTPPGLPPQFPPQPAVASKSKGPLFWILISIGVLVMVVICAAAVGSYFIYRVAKNVGNNPGLAVAKLAVAANPDLQTVSEDDGSGTITVRQKSTGDVMTLRFDSEKKTLIATDKDGKEARFSVSGDKNGGGSFEVNTDKGSIKFGASSSNTMPAWVPTYPGSAPQGTFSSQTPDGNQNVYSFKTKDGADKVLDFYAKELGDSGLKQSGRLPGNGYGGMQTFDDTGKGRTVMVTVSGSINESNVAIMVIEKKQP
jgi:hypothetical protein